MSTLNRLKVILSILLLSSNAVIAAENDISDKPLEAEGKSTVTTEKLADDPTKIVTKLGIGYNDDVTFNGSLGLDEARKINARINEDASEWTLGGSWLFDIGIINFNLGRSEYDDGGYKNNYSIGTFVPLSYFDITPMGWQIFPMAGFSYNDGESFEETADSLDNGFVLTPAASYGGYLGAFALRPLGDKWAVMTFVGGNLGSDDYSGYWAGGGITFAISGQDSLNLIGFVAEDNYGKQEKIGLNYSHEFDL